MKNKNELSKSQKTKDKILKAGLAIASQQGLEKTSIGDLAVATGLSRSGLFAHFASKESLQIDLLTMTAELFIQNVITPCEQHKDALKKLYSLKELWPDWYLRTSPPMTGGCLFLAAAIELDDQTGPVRDTLLKQQKRLLNYIQSLAELAQKQGVFKKELLPEQFAFEFYSLYMGYHYMSKFMKDKSARAKYNLSVDTLIARSK